MPFLNSGQFPEKESSAAPTFKSFEQDAVLVATYMPHKSTL